MKFNYIKSIKNGMIFFPLVFSTIITSIICIIQFKEQGLNLLQWDLMLVSGFLWLNIGIYLSMKIPIKMKNTLVRLQRRGVLCTSKNELEYFLKIRANRWSYWGSLIVGSAIFITFLVAFPQKVSLMILETVGACIAGWYLGFMASYGTLGPALKKKGVRYKAEPGHPDGVAGLKPLGKFYYFQAMVVAIPALHLGIWLILIQFWDTAKRYIGWKVPYLSLMPLALTFELVSFLVPIWFFHIEMKRQKLNLLNEADTLSQYITQIQNKLIYTEDPATYNLLKQKLADMIKSYENIENMPTWPIDLRTKLHFTFNNILLFIPLLTKFINDEHSLWYQFLDTLINFIENLE